MSPADLIGHLLGLLDVDEQRSVEQALCDDVAAGRCYETVRVRLAVLEIERVTLEMPADLASRTCKCVRDCCQGKQPGSTP